MLACGDAAAGNGGPQRRNPHGRPACHVDGARYVVHDEDERAARKLPGAFAAYVNLTLRAYRDPAVMRDEIKAPPGVALMGEIEEVSDVRCGGGVRAVDERAAERGGRVAAAAAV